MLVNVVDSMWEDNVFTNEPGIIMAAVPVWIRPDESVLTLGSLDMEMYSCDVRYVLQSGA